MIITAKLNVNFIVFTVRTSRPTIKNIPKIKSIQFVWIKISQSLIKTIRYRISSEWLR